MSISAILKVFYDVPYKGRLGVPRPFANERRQRKSSLNRFGGTKLTCHVEIESEEVHEFYRPAELGIGRTSLILPCPLDWFVLHS